MLISCLNAEQVQEDAWKPSGGELTAVLGRAVGHARENAINHSIQSSSTADGVMHTHLPNRELRRHGASSELL